MRPPLDRSRLDEAKRRVPLSAAARALGLGELKPKGVQRSPFREDRHPSFSVTGDALWRDHSTGEGGDVVSFIARATGCEDGEAIKRLLALAGLDSGLELPPLRLAPRPPAPTPKPPRDLLTGLDLRFPTVGELAEIRNARRWRMFAHLEIAARRDMLRIADVPHRGEVFKSWILTDSARRTGYARRLDGKPWPGPDGSGFKSNCLRNDADAPAGLADVVEADRPVVMLCEGDPDTLAAIFWAWLAGQADRVGVVRLSGNARAVTPAVAKTLTGRRVRIIRQADAVRSNGRKPATDYAAAWVATLTAAGIAVDVADLEHARPPGLAGDFDAADLLAHTDSENPEPIAAALLAGL